MQGFQPAQGQAPVAMICEVKAIFRELLLQPSKIILRHPIDFLAVQTVEGAALRSFGYEIRFAYVPGIGFLIAFNQHIDV